MARRNVSQFRIELPSSRGRTYVRTTTWRCTRGAASRGSGRGGRGEQRIESSTAELNTASTVGTARSVYASLREHEALHRNAADKVRSNDFFNIFGFDEAVPSRFGINDDCRPMLTLIETSRLVDPDSCPQSFELATRLKSLADGD